MTSSKPRDPKRRASARRASLEHVLVENEKIKASVEKAASDLTLVNDVLKQDAIPLQVMQQALTRNEDVEREVSKAADDLKVVNVTLADEMAERVVIESELASVRTDLAGVRDDLLNAQVREKAAREAALHDALTGLPNRASFEQGLCHGLIQATRHGWRLAVHFIDIDNFKSINDSYGHGLGDQVLRTTAARLRSFFRDEDIICRWGGDEFVCLLLDVQQEDSVAGLAKDLCEHISEARRFGEVTLVQGSAQIAMFPEDGETADALVRNADIAMYEAKGTETRVVLFQNTLTVPMTRVQHC
ncbi:MAG: GGDEF domain-containing protein [Holophagales bacterium]|nr:GGDEF domain-containing protein [Holophagales bacterium]